MSLLYRVKSERETPIQYIKAYIWNVKNGNDDPICKAAKETQRKNKLLDSVGEGGGGMIQESSVETCITICKIDNQCKHEAGLSKLVFWDIPEGWGGEGDERGVQDGGTHMHPWLIHVG